MSITPRSPSGVSLPPCSSRAYGRSGRAALTAGTLRTVGDDVAGEDVKRYVEGRDADRDDANVMHRTIMPLGTCCGHDFFTWEGWRNHREAHRMSRLRRWQTIR